MNNPKHTDILEIENIITGRKVQAPYITSGYLTSWKNSLVDGTWKITKKKSAPTEGSRL